MFRDLKEYHEIAKIYADKVSKPEDLEERRGGNLSPEQIQKNREGLKNRIMTGNPEGKRPDTSASNRRALLSKRPKPETDSTGKIIPSTASIRAKDAASGGTGMSNIPKKEGSAVIDGKKLNPDFGKKVDIKKEFPDKPKISKFTKQGKERTKAQMMAAKRIASGKTIQQVKDENKASMKAKAAERFADFKARRAEKTASMEEYTPYDIVLEYLLSTEQAATIEEANYVMTEMDAETIQGIVEMQGQINRADIIGGTPAAKNAAAGKGKYTPGIGVTKDFKLDPNFKLPKV